jgi:hypothetical protein
MHDEEVRVYPCNWVSVQLFDALGTQWRVGLSGQTGIDYSASGAVFELYAVLLNSAGTVCRYPNHGAKRSRR